MALPDDQKQETVQRFSGEIKKPAPKFFPASDETFDGNVNSRSGVSWVGGVPPCLTKSYWDTRITTTNNQDTTGSGFDDYFRVSIAENGRSGRIKSDPTNENLSPSYADNVECYHVQHTACDNLIYRINYYKNGLII